MGPCRILQFSATIFLLLCISNCNEIPKPRFDGSPYLRNHIASVQKEMIAKEKEILKDAFKKPIDGLGKSEMDVLKELTGNARSKFISDLEEEEVQQYCIIDTLRYLSDLVSFEDYAWRMRSSAASFPKFTYAAYELRGEYLGDYELCTGARSNGAPFDVQYCQMITIDNLQLGRCKPAACSEYELYIITNTIRAQLGIQAIAWYSCIPTSMPWTGDQIFVVFMVSFFSALVVVGTIYEITTRKIFLKLTALKKQRDDIDGGESSSKDAPNAKNENIYLTPKEEEEHAMRNGKVIVNTEGVKDMEIKTTPRPKYEDMLDTFLMSCSAINNLSKILRAKKTPDTLAALNGMRVISMFWIIYGHSNQFVIYSRLDNLGHYFSNIFQKKFWFMIVSQGTYSVDTFFMLSGFLLTYLTLKALRKTKGKMNWLLFYFHRYWRLTPAYAFCIGIWVSLFVRIGSGANMVEFFDYQKQVCADYWWTNLLYFNNLYPYPGSTGLCLGWGWYLANDMQFFILSPIILVLLFNPRLRRYGIMVMCFLAAVCFSSLIGLNYYYGLPAGKTYERYNNNSAEFADDADFTYTKPWCRINAYLAGMMYGYMLYRLKDRKLNLPWHLNLICWFFALGLMFALIFGLYGTDDGAPPQWFSVTWLTLDRTVWALCVGWVAFACVTGHGGPVNSILGWSFWIPLGRITYGAYLLHPMVIFWFLYTKKTSFHWTFQESAYFFIGNAVVSYILALILSLLVEGPTLGLEKVLLGKTKKK